MEEKAFATPLCSAKYQTFFWILKDHAQLLTPVITQVWNLSLSTHSWLMVLEEGEY